MKELLVIAISSAFVSNVVLSQFLGICSFVGVSKKVETAAGMGGAVIFVITIASIVAISSCPSQSIDIVMSLTSFASISPAPIRTGLSEDHRLYPCNCGSGTDRRNVLKEMYGFPVQRIRCIPSADHNQLCSIRCCTY